MGAVGVTGEGMNVYRQVKQPCGAGFHAAQVHIIQYSFLIILLIGSFLYIQNYLKRSAQGQLQAAGDQIGEQYAMGLTAGREHQGANSFYFQINTAGLNNPTRITLTTGNYRSTVNRRLRGLAEVWP